MKTRLGTCALEKKVAIAVLGLSALLVLMCNRSPAMAQSSPPQTALRDLIGDWQGAIGKQQIGLKIEAAESGGLKATLLLPDENGALPFDSTVLQSDGTLRLKLKQIDSSYTGRLSPDKNSIVGTWNQSGSTVAISFRRPGTVQRFTLQPRKQGQVSLQPCRTPDGNIEGLCGTYDVFENRQTHTGRKISLNIMLLPAGDATPQPDPFFAIAGGPGQSAVETFPGAAFVRRLRASRDVVLVDQRGTGKSNPLECELHSPSDLQAVVGEPYSDEAIRRCREQSDKKADTTQYTTSVASDDLDEVRQALGYDKINVYGGSYGSYAALVYLRMHGDHLRTITLSAVAAPNLHIALHFAPGVQNSVEGIISLCESYRACQADYPTLRAEFKALLERLSNAPAQFELSGQKLTLSREMFVSRLRSLLYVPQFISLFPQIIHNAYNNDWRLYGGLVVELRNLIEGQGHIAWGMSFSAICAEDVPGLTGMIVRSVTAGTWMGDSQVRRYEQYCRVWGTVGKVPKDFFAPIRASVPALLISGGLDPGTPPDVAREVARNISNSRLVLVKHGTHTTGSECIDGLVAQFVAQGSATRLDTSCADQIHLPTFAPKPAAIGHALHDRLEHQAR
jgi:pimeloyl-ACP methyl ester carboxylesterase